MIGMLVSAGCDPGEVFTGAGYAPPALDAGERAAIRGPGALGADDLLDIPRWLVPVMRADLGDAFDAVAGELRARAPAFLRVNTRLCDRPSAVARLAEDGIVATAHDTVATALVVETGLRRVQGSRAMADGLVELQDASSQAVVRDVADILKGARVLDYCAGGGGKTLAIAAHGPARLAAHDGEPRRMRDLPARARRAGVTVDILSRGDAARAAPWDVVFVDAPCSGSGAWRRQPEAKWRLTEARLTELIRTQDGILAEAARLVGAGGRLCYVTCSVLSRENGARVTQFLEDHAGWTAGRTSRYLPGANGDGFFLAELVRESA